VILLLSEPAWASGCPKCNLECAVIPKRLAWLTGEIDRLCRERSINPACEATGAKLAIALRAHEEMARRHAASPHGSNKASHRLQ